MTELRLRLHQPRAAGQLEVGAMAEIRQLTDYAGHAVARAWRTTKSIGVSGGTGDDVAYTEFNLPAAGRYAVNIIRPRGDDLTLEYQLAEDEIRDETVTLKASPHEYLGWQQFTGIVRANPYTPEWRVSATEPPTIGAEPTPGSVLFTLGQERLRDLYTARGSVPEISQVSVPDSSDAWAWIAAATRDDRTLLKTRVALDDWVPAYEDEFCTWFRKMPEFDECYALIESLREETSLQPEFKTSVAAKFPRWVLVDMNGQLDLASIPWVWFGGTPHKPDEEIHLLYDRVRPSPADPKAPGRFIVSLQDSRWGGLLEFVASGRLNEAAKMADDVFRREPPEEALYGKLKGPLSAVLGGIVLISRTTTVEEQYWDEWLGNLARWFPGIPDGEILLGYRLLQRGRVTEGQEHLQSAVRRGLPFFTASIQMLSVGLAQVGDDELARIIGPVAARVDPTQPFTVIRLRRRS